MEACTHSRTWGDKRCKNIVYNWFLWNITHVNVDYNSSKRKKIATLLVWWATHCVCFIHHFDGFMWQAQNKKHLSCLHNVSVFEKWWALELRFGRLQEVPACVQTVEPCNIMCADLSERVWGYSLLRICVQQKLHLCWLQPCWWSNFWWICHCNYRRRFLETQ